MREEEEEFTTELHGVEFGGKIRLNSVLLRGYLLLILGITLLYLGGCKENALTGNNTINLMPNALLFPMAFSEYETFLNENTVVSAGPDAEMVARVGDKIAAAAQKWFDFEDRGGDLKDYRWEYKLVQDDQINAWCMPGGKIVVYTGILPVTQNEDGLAVVMGHEVAHALLNHGQQRMSAGLLQQLGATAAGAFTDSQLIMGVYGVSTNLAIMLPFSRKHESESDRYGLTLMTIAGYNPEEAVPFWQRMAAQGGGGTLEFLSTHPSHNTRINDLRGWVSEAKTQAAEINSKEN